jgi:hypothetical protein
LRHGQRRAGKQRRQCGDQSVGGQSGQPVVQRAGRLVKADRRRTDEVHGPGVEARVHLHHADTRRRIPGEHGTLNRRRAAPARQQRRVQIDAAEPRPIEPLARQQQPVGNDDHEIGPFGVLEQRARLA